MKKKNNLDEMQEQELLKIEHNGCWLAFWLLLAALAIQTLIYNTADFRTVAGEWIVFMVLAIYLGVACARKGIWDRRIEMNTKSNLVVSLIAAAAVALFNGILIFRNYHKPVGTIAAALFIGAITFALCFAALSFSMKKTARRQAAMEAEPEDADEL